MHGSDFFGANLEGASFLGADLTGVSFQDANLVGAYFAENLSAIREHEFGEPLEGANFSRASTFGVAFRAINLRVTNLTAEQLAVAFGDASATLPEGMARPCHWGAETLEVSNTPPADREVSILYDTWDGSFRQSLSGPYIARWHGWVEANGGEWPISSAFNIFPDYADVEAIPPPPECPLIRDIFLEEPFISRRGFGP